MMTDKHDNTASTLLGNNCCKLDALFTANLSDASPLFREEDRSEAYFALARASFEHVREQ